MLYMVTFTINIPQMLAYIITIHGSYGFGYDCSIFPGVAICVCSTLINNDKQCMYIYIFNSVDHFLDDSFYR